MPAQKSWGVLLQRPMSSEPGENAKRLIRGSFSAYEVGRGSDGDEAVLIVMELHACHGDLVSRAQKIGGGEKMPAGSGAKVVDPHVDRSHVRELLELLLV